MADGSLDDNAKCNIGGSGFCVLGDSRDYEVLACCLVSNYRPAGFKWNCGAFELWCE